MRTLVSFDPATGEPVGEVAVTPIEAIAEIVGRARAAQPAWADLGLDARLALLASAAPTIAASVDALGQLANREMGKPLREAVGEARSIADWTRELDELREAFAPSVREQGSARTTTLREPFGVCAAITPWNFPLAMPHWLVLPALAAGNTVVLKPSEETPLCAQAYVDALVAVLPPGVLQVVHGDGAQGAALVDAPVDLVAFTGSRETGVRILQACAGRLVRVVLELGGKDPLVVCDDADLDRAADFAARNSFRNAGQVCVSTERIYVQASVADAFIERLVAASAKVAIGPMVSAKQKAKVVNQVREALASGAELRAGSLDGPGNFLAPIVLTRVSHDMAVMRDETFGPVVGVMAVADDDEAVRLANDSPFGLGAIVFAGDQARGERVATRLKAGMVGVNRGVGGVEGSPWVGVKASGYGFHSGVEGHRQFAQLRLVTTGR